LGAATHHEPRIGALSVFPDRATKEQSSCGAGRWCCSVAPLKRVLWHLLGGTRGGPMRIRIIRLLRDRPLNTNQVTKALGIDYKTAEHHLRVLRENRIATPTGDKYGAVFLLTKEMEDSLAEFDHIVEKMRTHP